MTDYGWKRAGLFSKISVGMCGGNLEDCGRVDVQIINVRGISSKISAGMCGGDL
jgi:hypothetical protein